MVPPVPMSTILGRPSRNSTSDSGLSLAAGRSTTVTSAPSVILTPTLYPLFTFSISTSGALNS